MNTMKTFLLMAVLGAMVVGIGGMLGGQTGLVIAFGIAVAMNMGSYWFSDRIVLRMYGAKELSRDEAPELFRMTEDLAQRGGIPMPRLYLIPGDTPNAFATGRSPEHGAVAVTEGIVRMLSRDELRGVIAHELAHIKHRDILVGSLAATFAAAISMIANMATWAMVFAGRSDDDENPISALLMLILAPIAATMVQLAISRSREFLADEGGARMSGDPLALANALRRLERGADALPMNATPATAHLFIVSPLRGRGISRLFSTHPSMEERIARLEALAYGTSMTATR